MRAGIKTLLARARSKGALLIVLVLIISLLPTVSFATISNGNNYYVSTAGADSDPGTRDKPWKTIEYAGRKLQAGDILNIYGGIYQEHAFFTNSGTRTNPILVTNYNGEEVIIDGNNNQIAHQLVAIMGDWVIIRNITIRYSGGEGIVAVGKHVTLDNLFVHHNRDGGAALLGDYDTIINSRIWYNSTMNENGQSSKWSFGVTCARYPNHCTIRNNRVWENWGEGISTFEALNTTIEGNYSYDNQLNFYISDTKYTSLNRNISYCTTGNLIDTYDTQVGILVDDEKGVPIPLGSDGVRYPSSDNTISNNIVVGCNHNFAANTSISLNNLYAYNTFFNAAGSTDEPYNIVFYSGITGNSKFVNNIIVQNDERYIGLNAGTGITFFHNLWSKDPPSNMLGKADIVSDPLFTMIGDPYSVEWYELKASSPAIDHAIVLPEIMRDFLRGYRIYPPDIGALEKLQPRYKFLLFLPVFFNF